LVQGGADALLVTDTAENILNQHVIRDFAETHRLPAIFSLPFVAEPGWLLAFGVDFPGLLRQLAHQLDQVLRGTSPGEIPVHQATKFELVVNLKTAKALGLTVPFALVASADIGASKSDNLRDQSGHHFGAPGRTRACRGLV
jgi:putative tryptophan/tyrosine transport system substrate-binding protein